MSRRLPGNFPQAGPVSVLLDLVAAFPGAAVYISSGSLWCNRLAERLTGYPAGDIPTVDSWFRTLFRGDEAGARRVYHTARELGFPQPDVLHMRRGDGSTARVEFSGFLAGEEEVWLLRDVTAVESAEQELHDRERRLEATIEVAGLATWEWDVETGSVIRQEGPRLFGLTSDLGTLTWLAYLEQIHSHDRPVVDEAIATAIANQGSFDVTFRVRSKGHSDRWLHMHGVVVEDPDRPLRVIGATQDVTERKQLEEQLIRAARMESLGRLAGGVAHDFNNLLAIVRGHVEFLLRDPSLSAAALRRIRSIDHVAERGAALVGDLMGLSHPRHAGGEAVDLNEMIDREADAMRQLLGEDVLVRLDLQADPAYVHFNTASLEAVLLNLAANARDAMPEGGEFCLSTANRQVGHDGAPRIELTVADTGVGMDEATMARVFEPFYTTKDPAVGTGLGLATAYVAIVSVGGSIDVASTIGSGTTFTIDLPALSTLPPPAGASPWVAPSGRNAEIMIVEDDPEVLELAADILREEGHRVIEALGAEEALSLVASGEKPELVVTDVVMPRLTGPQLVAKLREMIPELAVLYMSGYTSDRRTDIAIDAASLLRKPFTHRELRQRVERLLS